MKTLTCLLAGCLAVGIVTSLWAEVDPDFQTAMKGAAAACGRVKKNVEAKANAEDMAKDAEEAAQNFRKMGGYFKQKNTDDAFEMCKQAFIAAMGVSKAAKAGNMDEAATQLKALNGTCAGCHHAHREKAADGSYSIK